MQDPSLSEPEKNQLIEPPKGGVYWRLLGINLQKPSDIEGPGEGFSIRLYVEFIDGVAEAS